MLDFRTGYANLYTFQVIRRLDDFICLLRDTEYAKACVGPHARKHTESLGGGLLHEIAVGERIRSQHALELLVAREHVGKVQKIENIREGREVLRGELTPLDGPSQHFIWKNGLPAQAAGFMNIDLQFSTGVLLGFLLKLVETCDHDALGRFSKRMSERQDVIGFGRARRSDDPRHRDADGGYGAPCL